MRISDWSSDVCSSDLGEAVDPAKIEYLRRQYGLDRPMHEQYLRWAGALLQGDMGYSFEYGLPVNEVVGDRLLLTVIVSAATIETGRASGRERVCQYV